MSITTQNAEFSATLSNFFRFKMRSVHSFCSLGVVHYDDNSHLSYTGTTFFFYFKVSLEAMSSKFAMTLLEDKVCLCLKKKQIILVVWKGEELCNISRIIRLFQ